MRQRPLFLALAPLALLAAVASARAEDVPADAHTREKANAERPKDGAVVTASREGFAIQSEDGGFRLKIGGYAQGDARIYVGDANRDGVDTFVLRRVRPMLTGTVGRYFDFTLMPDFGLGTAVVQESFLDARFSPAFRVKAGKFKGPVGLERLQSGAALTFAERGLPTDIVPNREVGVQVHGEIGGGIVYYQAGIFDGVLDGSSIDTDTNDGKDLEGRLFLQPFKKSAYGALKGLGLGIAGTSGDQSGAVPVYRTLGQLVFFAYGQGVTADGKRTRLAPQASYQNGRFRALGEWVSSRQRLRKTPIDTLVAANRAWQGVASFVLTGEAAVSGIVTPNKPFDPASGGWGALELAARYGALDVDGDVFAAGYADPLRSAQSATAWGVGLNWYVNRNVKYVANYDHTVFRRGGADGGNRQAENAVFLRAQVSF